MTTIINMPDMLERLDGDMEIFRATCSAFVEITPEILTSISGSLSRKMFNQIARDAHSLKGASSNISADIFRDLSIKLETAAKANNEVACKESIEKLFTHYSELEKHIIDNNYLEDEI